MGKEILTQERLKELLDYDPETGVFRWKMNVGQRARIGVTPGTIHPTGYIHIKIAGRSYVAHRLVWLWVYGSWPTDQIDHKNGVRSDNRITNLREVTRSENLQNQRRARTGTRSGFLGVTKQTHTTKWQATINVGGKNVYLGVFATPQLAHEAYLTAKRQFHTTCTI